MSGSKSAEVTREPVDSTSGGARGSVAAERAVVTLPPPVAAAARRMGAELGGVGVAEVVRRGLMVLDLLVSLEEDEELVIRNKATRECDRLRFSWQSF